ncbi:hypothetical protein [Stenotrophomonas oahuensis]|uniref:Uncharacterized protein n=1 Tax=Stenotrophomonas oahuensis TaxID=3003271 RepID=A0ABY9YV80_9GAMM|nr:hypothetical protein [Stenotrophomonas sp. A5586]WNH54821.1 hypothetical protein PDM29_20975 [Stenotrophomonas sp. A5586]
MSEESPPYLPSAYPPASDALGYMPKGAVYAALDFVVALASSEPPDASEPAVAAARDLLTRWLQLNRTQGDPDILSAQADMYACSNDLVAALRDALEGFVADLADHPSPEPGSVFGDYYRLITTLLGEA